MEETGGIAPPLSDQARRQRDIDLKVGMLQSLMTRYSQLANRAEAETSAPRVVSRAMPPSRANRLRPALILGLGLGGALGLGGGLAAYLELVRGGFRTTQQIKSELGLPTLGLVPALKRLPKAVGASDYMIDKPTSVYAEAIKSAQLAILDARPETQIRTILVASSLPGEGKTSFAVSLARSLAGNGYRVLLMDCDFRRPAVGRHFGVNPTPGLVDFLWQQAAFEEVVRQDERTGLYFVPAGSHCEDPQKLLDSSLGSTLLHALMARFDMAIIDTPPTMVASDAAVLAKAADLILYVVAWDRTPRGAVQAGVDYLRTHGGEVGGVVLSKVDLAKRGRYGDYVDYAFRGGAGYYAK
jgi:capsular exopolysaccharide synthesis family protein